MCIRDSTGSGVAKSDDRDDEDDHTDHGQDDPGQTLALMTASGLASQATTLCVLQLQTSIPNRRADRWRCRLARNRRKRLTSIGSALSADGVSIKALSTW